MKAKKRKLNYTKRKKYKNNNKNNKKNSPWLSWKIQILIWIMYLSRQTSAFRGSHESYDKGKSKQFKFNFKKNNTSKRLKIVRKEK